MSWWTKATSGFRHGNWWQLDNLIDGTLNFLNETGKAVGLQPDPYSDKGETYVDLGHTSTSKPLLPTAIRNEDFYNNYVENTKPIYKSEAPGEGHINTDKPIVDNFTPNTAKTGGNQMATKEESWWDRNGSDIMKFATTALTLGGNYYNQQLQNEFNEKEAQKQRNFEENMANTAHQREAKDLELAGINPIASGNMGGADTTAGAAASGATPYYADPMTIANTALTQAQTMNLKADTELKGIQSGKTAEETKGLEIENQYKDQLKQLEILSRQITNEKDKAIIQKTYAEVHKMETELRKLDEEIEILKSEGKIKEAEAKTRTRNRRAYAILEMAESATRAVGNIVNTGKNAAAAANIMGTNINNAVGTIEW